MRLSMPVLVVSIFKTGPQQISMLHIQKYKALITIKWRLELCEREKKQFFDAFRKATIVRISSAIYLTYWIRFLTCRQWSYIQRKWDLISPSRTTDLSKAFNWFYSWIYFVMLCAIFLLVLFPSPSIVLCMPHIATPNEKLEMCSCEKKEPFLYCRLWMLSVFFSHPIRTICKSAKKAAFGRIKGGSTYCHCCHWKKKRNSQKRFW